MNEKKPELIICLGSKTRAEAFFGVELVEVAYFKRFHLSIVQKENRTRSKRLYRLFFG